MKLNLLKKRFVSIDRLIESELFNVIYYLKLIISRMFFITCTVFLTEIFWFSLSTSSGLLTDRDARTKKLGGEILFYIW